MAPPADFRTSTPEGPPCPIYFTAPYHAVRAMRFDGSRASAAAIAAKFPGLLAWSVERDGVLLALAGKPFCFDKLNELAPGCWLIEVSRGDDVFTLMSDDHFRAAYKASLYQGDG